ncbi:hypothetical protein ACF0H5_020466 [Mactra antiquata]
MLYGSDIDKRWAWMVAMAVFLGKLTLSTSLYMSGVIYIALLEYYSDDDAKTSLIGSLNSGIMCLIGPFVSILIDATSCRTSMFIGGLLLSLSYVVSVFVDNINVLILTLGVIGGIANSMTSVPCCVILGYYFQKWRTTMISVSTCVVGLAMFISSPLALFLLANYELKGTFLLVGGINLHLCIFAFICRPSTEEIRLKQTKKTQCLKPQDDNRLSSPIFLMWETLARICNVKLFNNISFMLFLLSTTSWNFMASVCLMHLPNYVTTQGLPPSAITIIMTTFGVCNTLGRFLAAMCVAYNKIDSIKIHIGSLGILGGATLCFPFYGHLENACFVFAALAGLLTGIPNSAMTPISLKLVGIENLSSAHGLENFFCGIGIVVGPPIAGLSYEKTSSYTSSFMISGIVVLVGCVLGCMSMAFTEKVCIRNANDVDKTLTKRDETSSFIERVRLKDSLKERRQSDNSDVAKTSFV